MATKMITLHTDGHAAFVDAGKVSYIGKRGGKNYIVVEGCMLVVDEAPDEVRTAIRTAEYANPRDTFADRMKRGL